MRPSTILAAIGNLPQDEAVMRRALDLARSHRAALTFVHILDFLDRDSDPGLDNAPQVQAARAARARIDAALLGLNADPAKVEVIVEPGNVARRLIEICADRRPGLLVMRVHQRSRFIDRFVGSTVDRVVAAAVAPVLIVRRPPDQPYRQVLIATDEGDHANQVLSFVATLLPDAALHLVQAVDVAPQLEEAMLRVGTGPILMEAHREKLIGAACDRLRVLAQTVSPQPTSQVLKGDPAKVLVRASYVPRVDLVAVGPARSGPVRRILVGSVTRRLLNEAASDVLICHPGQPAA